MANYNCDISVVSRGNGSSAIASAAYNAGVKLVNNLTGQVNDYTRKSGVLGHFMILPDDAPDWAANRNELWNAAEQKDARVNSTLARQALVSLPIELDADARTALTERFAVWICERFNVGVDAAVHEPSREGDQRNFHAHIQFTTRVLMADGLGAKTRELDSKKTGGAVIKEIRKRWEVLANAALEAADKDARVDCRSLADKFADMIRRADALDRQADAIEARWFKASKLSRKKRDEEELRLEDLRGRADALRIEAEEFNREPNEHLGPSRNALRRKEAREAKKKSEAKRAELVRRERLKAQQEIDVGTAKLASGNWESLFDFIYHRLNPDLGGRAFFKTLEEHELLPHLAAAFTLVSAERRKNITKQVVKRIMDWAADMRIAFMRVVEGPIEHVVTEEELANFEAEELAARELEEKQRLEKLEKQAKRDENPKVPPKPSKGWEPPGM